jgi:hypothetical protein
MKPQEQFHVILGVVMVTIYLFGGIFVIVYAKELFPENRLPNILGWVMIAYSFMRVMRVYEIIKKSKKEAKKNPIKGIKTSTKL